MKIATEPQRTQRHTQHPNFCCLLKKTSGRTHTETQRTQSYTTPNPKLYFVVLTPNLQHQKIFETQRTKRKSSCLKHIL